MHISCIFLVCTKAKVNPNKICGLYLYEFSAIFTQQYQYTHVDSKHKYHWNLRSGRRILEYSSLQIWITMILVITAYIDDRVIQITWIQRRGSIHVSMRVFWTYLGPSVYQQLLERGNHEMHIATANAPSVEHQLVIDNLQHNIQRNSCRPHRHIIIHLACIDSLHQTQHKERRTCKKS
jgi:hypothetical protein